MAKTIGVALIGCGGITLQNHMPGLALCKNAKLTALCDADEKVLERAKQQTGITAAATDYKEIVKRDDVDAVIIATPNFVHAPIALAAAANKKHVFCEKPIAMNTAEAVEMFNAAEKAGVRHMTAFTYRFVPAMRYMAHLIKTGAVGQPYHYRSCRLQDWGARALGWRQVAKLAGSGELGDMLSHRVDYAHYLLGPIVRLSANTRRFFDDRSGQKSDLEDWVALIADFANNATGVLESSKLATGRGEGAHSQDYVEVNGSDGSLLYQLEQPLELQVAKKGESNLRTVKVPDEFLKWPGAPRDSKVGDPVFTFRYDQTFEFIDAIANNRPCTPSFYDGTVAQAVMDTALKAAAEKRWLEVDNPLKGKQNR